MRRLNEKIKRLALQLFKRKRLLVFLVIAVVLLETGYSFTLRKIGYDKIPEPFIIMDERTWVWQGLSIRKNGIPAGWSDLSIYKQGVGGDADGLKISVNGVKPDLSNYAVFPKPAIAVLQFDYGKGLRHTQFVQPLIEQPPLGSIILGLLVPDSVDSFQKLSPADFRRMSLYLAVFTQILIFIVGWQLFKNIYIGALASILYGSIPVFILMSRYGLLENVLAPVLLLVISLLLLTPSLKKKLTLNSVLITAGLFTGTAALIKISGWIVLVMGVVVLIYLGFKLKQILLYAIPAVLVGGLYFVWGLYLAPQLFVNILLFGGIERGFVGSLNLLTSTTKVNIINFPFEGFWLGGFLSFLFIDWNNHKLFAIPVIVITFSALVLSGLNNPWYYIPIVPFMCFGMALFIWKIVTNPSLFNLLTFFFVYFSSSLYWGYIVYKTPANVPHYQYQPFSLYKLILFSFLILGLLWSRYPERLNKFKIFWFIFIFLIFYQMTNWNYRSFLYILSEWGKIPSIFVLGVE